MLGGPLPGMIATEGVGLAEDAAEDPRTVETVERLLGGPAVARLVGAVLESPATLSLTESILGSPEIDTKKAFAGVMKTFDNTRPLFAGMAIGVALAALERTRELLRAAGVPIDGGKAAGTYVEAEL